MKALDFPLLTDENIHPDVITLFTGIIYLRPGHIHADFTIKTLEAIRDNAPEVAPPFILVAERAGDIVRIRVRQL